MPTTLITGANRGIGLEFARQYREDGWRVIATARERGSTGALEALGAEIHLLDVTDTAAVARLGETLAGEAIDVLIANAGISGPRGMTPDKVDAEGWVETLRVNAIAPIALAGALRGAVARSRERKAIAISSRLGSIGANAEGGLYPYRSSKAALNAAWRSLAVDAPELIAVVLHPGWVRTDMGGANADLPPEESVAGMRRVIARLTKAESGRFFAWDGDEIPW